MENGRRFEYSPQPSGEACDEQAREAAFRQGRLRAAALKRYRTMYAASDHVRPALHLRFERGSKPAERPCRPMRASARRHHVRFERGSEPAERTHVCQNCGPPRAEASARRSLVGSKCRNRPAALACDACSDGSLRRHATNGYQPPHNTQANRHIIFHREAHPTRPAPRPYLKHQTALPHK